LEHKLFESEDGDAFSKYAKTGAYANAFTSFDRTCYIFSCSELFDENLDILLDFVQNPYFTAETVQKEQGIIGQEIRMYEDHAGARLQQNLMRAMYKKNKMRVDVLGTEESIGRITPEILYKCHSIFYNLNNMALAICGDVDTCKVEEICDKLLEKAPTVAIIRDTEDSDEPREVNEKRTKCALRISKPVFAIGIKDMDISENPDERMKKAYGVNILNEVLFSQSSKIFNELYDANLISHDLSAVFEHTKNCSFVYIASESSDPEAVYEYFVNYIKHIQESGIDREEFELAKRTVFASNIKSFDSTGEIANNMIYNLFDGADILDAPDIISSIDYEYVSELLNSMYKEEYYTMSVVEPLKK
jgi:predicted Zn-dependent peptidase